ncbi:hypothetical protein EXU85_22050 [Spirosoma sp. KCTC 42546]|uniref:hypothetical protein n=1 Tax=Spirosoma sp. KCTC 42546 TaxID=2520506 RepID=UPI00115BD5B8|nr:hypothetical protein [Spirosoma sp. KCTC 42546]QDK81152.1 hypothetical protein EXU85_22050 [Spirosoma sp. KCTC 42546]
MDFNDFKKRIERVYASIGQMSTEDYQKQIRWKPGTFEFSFGSKENATDESKVVSTISAIADLKDNIKNKMSSVGLKPQLVEDEINKSLYLQLITDLDNQQKHGYPLTKSKRSGLDPLIKNVKSVVSFTVTQSDNFISFDLTTGKVTPTGAVAKGEIDAEITDSTGKVICDLDELITTAMSTWENFIATHKLA